MPVKKGNKTIQITLTPWHDKKLSLLERRTGLSKTGVVQRLIEGQPIMEMEEKELGEKKEE